MARKRRWFSSDDGPKRPKYPRIRGVELSPRDTKALARLVDRYGPNAIAEAARWLKPTSKRSKGRPYKGRALFERMHMASCIEDWAEEYKLNGKPNPFRLAMIDWHEFVYSDPEIEKRDFDVKYEKALKKKFYKGRRELREWRELLERRKEQRQTRK